MSDKLKKVKVAIVALGMKCDKSADFETLKDQFLDKADALISAVGGPDNVALALTEDHITLYNELLEDGEEDGGEDALSLAPQKPPSAASPKQKNPNRVLTPEELEELPKKPKRKLPEKPKGHKSIPMGKKDMRLKVNKTKKDTPVAKLAIPINVTPHAVRKNFTRVSSIMKVLKAGGGHPEEIIKRANDEYIRHGGKGHIKESRHYYRIVIATLHHLGLIILGEDKIVTIRQER